MAIVAPGGYAPDEAELQRGLEGLAGFGCSIRNYYDHDARFQRFGATDAGRAAQLHAAAADPQVEPAEGSVERIVIGCT